MPVVVTSRGRDLSRPLKPILSEQEAAEYLQITTTRLRRLGYERRGPPTIKIGRERRFRRTDLLDWIEAQAR